MSTAKKANEARQNLQRLLEPTIGRSLADKVGRAIVDLTEAEIALAGEKAQRPSDMSRLRDLLLEKFETVETEIHFSDDGPYLTARLVVDGELRHLALHRVATPEQDPVGTAG